MDIESGILHGCLLVSANALPQGKIRHAIVRLNGYGSAIWVTETSLKHYDKVFVQTTNGKSEKKLPLSVKA